MYVVQTGTTHWHCRYKFFFASDKQVSRVQKHTSSAAVVCAGFDDIVQSESSQMAALLETVCFGWQSQNCTIKSTNTCRFISYFCPAFFFWNSAIQISGGYVIFFWIFFAFVGVLWKIITSLLCGSFLSCDEKKKQRHSGRAQDGQYIWSRKKRRWK